MERAGDPRVACLLSSTFLCPMDIRVRTFITPVGELLLGSFGDELCLCDWRYRRMRDAVDKRIRSGLGANYVEGTSPIIEQAFDELTAYFAGKRTRFELPLRFVGTELQQRVWRALLDIPFGTTTTYGSLTALVAQSTAIRAVAAANGANALSVVVPCHRVIGSAGELVGYAGGLDAKRALLALEGVALPCTQPELFPVPTMQVPEP